VHLQRRLERDVEHKLFVRIALHPVLVRGLAQRGRLAGREEDSRFAELVVAVQ
jgi:hypothetical protein